MNVTKQLLQLAIEAKLSDIEAILGEHYKLTLIASHDGNNGLKNADIVLTLVDRKTILRALDRFLPENGVDLSQRKRRSTIGRSKCKNCGCDIDESCDYCGECLCEEDGL